MGPGLGSPMRKKWEFGVAGQLVIVPNTSYLCEKYPVWVLVLRLGVWGAVDAKSVRSQALASVRKFFGLGVSVLGLWGFRV